MNEISANNPSVKKPLDDVAGWLCESRHAAIRYRTMTQLQDMPESGMEMEQLYRAIWESKDIQRMLQRQNADGIWEHSKKEYGSHTSLRYLTSFAELGLHQDDRLDRAAEYAVHFLIENEDSDMRHDYSGCSTALVLRALVMLGYHHHARVEDLLEEYAASQLSDGGFICKRLLAKKPTRKSCYKASLAALLLYAVCEQRSIHLPETDRLLEYFLKRDVFYRSADRTKLLLDGRPGWRSIDNFFPVEPMRIGLPLTMASLAILGAGSSPALAKGWAILAAKENENDRYVLEGTLTRQPCKFGKVGEENEWVTFYALLAEKYRNSAMGTGENDARV